MTILNDKQIKQKINRLAYEIIEQNIDEEKVYLAGINNNGYTFAGLLLESLQSIKDSPVKFELMRLRLNPASPLSHPIEVDGDPKLLKNASVVIIDDVANTGRTLFYGFRPFLSYAVKKIQICVLVDRKHKSYPTLVDFVGISLATTLNENIEVDFNKTGHWSVDLN